MTQLMSVAIVPFPLASTELAESVRGAVTGKKGVQSVEIFQVKDLVADPQKLGDFQIVLLVVDAGCRGDFRVLPFLALGLSSCSGRSLITMPVFVVTNGDLPNHTVFDLGRGEGVVGILSPEDLSSKSPAVLVSEGRERSNKLSDSVAYLRDALNDRDQRESLPEGVLAFNLGKWGDSTGSLIPTLVKPNPIALYLALFEKTGGDFKELDAYHIFRRIGSS